MRLLHNINLILTRFDVCSHWVLRMFPMFLLALVMFPMFSLALVIALVLILPHSIEMCLDTL